MTKTLPWIVLCLALARPTLAQTMTAITPIDLGFTPTGGATPGAATTNATNENAQIIGRLYIEGGSGTKTLSAAGGGSIVLFVGAVTFVTASSEVRAGLEDVNSSGLGDGTQDVYGARIAGTTPITASSLNRFAMSSGTKTVTHGDKLAITVRMPVRAGADTVNWGTFIESSVGSAPSLLPYGVINGSKTTEMLTAIITFDDGALGWIFGQPFGAGSHTFTVITMNTGTTPDELVAGFTVPSPIQISRIAVLVDTAAAADDYEIILYADPFGTPAVIETISIDSGADTMEGTTAGMVWGNLSTPRTLTPTQTGGYGVALRPTTANSIDSYYWDLTSGFSDIKRANWWLTNLRVGTRTDQTGAFTEVQTYYVPYFGITVSGLPSGAGTSGGERSYAY